IPDLKGKFDGMAMRVPTPTVSIVDFVCTVNAQVTTEQVKEAFTTAANGPLKGILQVCNEPLVSMDFKGNPASSIIDMDSTMAMGNMVKCVTWYDNEWGYSNRVADLLNFMASRKLVVTA
ncbi:MAG: type I glyceraldehyde-3-phosphate dehydrogenase, partial [Candidatus Eremiobacteraeota bacterium]|nr:type I glyceraldehyde-3-phosphate dehydrogenase [Candidatus Eremiobacteraeota bacterium]